MFKYYTPEEYKMLVLSWKLFSHWYWTAYVQELFSYHRSGWPVIWPTKLDESGKQVLLNIKTAVDIGIDFITSTKYSQPIELQKHVIADAYIEAMPMRLRSKGYAVHWSKIRHYQGVTGYWIFMCDPYWDVSPFFHWDKMGNKIILNIHSKFVHLLEPIPRGIEIDFLDYVYKNKATTDWYYKLHFRNVEKKAKDIREFIRLSESAFWHEDVKKDRYIVFSNYWRDFWVHSKLNIPGRPQGYFLFYYEPQGAVEVVAHAIWSKWYETSAQEWYWILTAENYQRFMTTPYSKAFMSIIRHLVYDKNMRF